LPASVHLVKPTSAWLTATPLTTIAKELNLQQLAQQQQQQAELPSSSQLSPK